MGMSDFVKNLLFQNIAERKQKLAELQALVDNYNEAKVAFETAQAELTKACDGDILSEIEKFQTEILEIETELSPQEQNIEELSDTVTDPVVDLNCEELTE